MSSIRSPYPSDVSDDEWAFVAPYLALLAEDAGQRKYALREVFNGLRYIVKTGAHWRMLPHDLPPWATVYQQLRRWRLPAASRPSSTTCACCLRRAAGRDGQPTAAILDSRTIQSTPESGAAAGYDGYKRRKGRKVHVAVDTLGHLLALLVTPANAQDRAQVAPLAAAVQEATGEHGRAGLRRPGLHRRGTATAAAAHGHASWGRQAAGGQARLRAALLAAPLGGRALFAWAARFRRLALRSMPVGQLATLAFVAAGIITLGWGAVGTLSRRAGCLALVPGGLLERVGAADRDQSLRWVPDPRGAATQSPNAVSVPPLSP